MYLEMAAKNYLDHPQKSIWTHIFLELSPLYDRLLIFIRRSLFQEILTAIHFRLSISES